ncbi:MAG: DUF4139 domain-containing protein [Aureispira sp.]|nr:DUF4139 domain-containing protein [Aureispira sp.]
MKKTMFLLITWFTIAQAMGQVKEQRIATDIDAVKLHLDGAEIIRNHTLNLSPGRHQLIFTNLSPKMYYQTIQASASSGVKILSVSNETNFMERRKDSPRAKGIRDSIDQVRTTMDLLSDEKNAYYEEKNMLQQNRSIKGNNSNLTVAELSAAADFYRSRNFEINKALSKLQKKLEKSGRELLDLKLQLREINSDHRPTAEVHLVVETDKNTSTTIDLRYVVSDAGWAAIYDLEAGDFNKPIDLGYRGLAYNNTGVDWENVKLTLSTADPLQNMVQPCLTVWNLDSYSNIDHIATNINININKNNSYPAQQQRIDIDLDNGVYEQEVQTILGDDYQKGIDYNTDKYRDYVKNKNNSGPTIVEATLDVPEFNADFEIEKPYTIPSDRKPYSVDINTFKLPTTYKYYAVPKLDKDAFLMAQVVGWEDLDLVSGNVNIYNDGKYIGQSYIDIRNLSDTLSVSLGRDADVVVTRTKIKGSAKKQLFGSQKKASMAYQINVRNNHSKAITIEIQDQVPISNDKEVIITVDEKSDADYDPEIGVLTWQFTLGAKKNKEFKMGFSIKYPKDKKVHIQYKKSRKMKQARYF